MMPLRIVIADDERAARRKLELLLAAIPSVEIVAQASNGRETVVAIQETKPDVVLLDVQMPALDGFEALTAVGRESGPKIVFVTAFDAYAVRAFEVRAFDYLLKPFDGARLSATLDRAREQLAIERWSEAPRISDVLNQLRGDGAPVASIAPASTPFIERVCSRSNGKTQFVRIAETEWIEAYGNYVRLHTAKGRVLLRDTMGHLLSQLDPARFARVHRSAIANLDRVREMRSCLYGDYVILLESGTRLRLSRSYRAEFDRRLGRR